MLGVGDFLCYVGIVFIQRPVKANSQMLNHDFQLEFKTKHFKVCDIQGGNGGKGGNLTVCLPRSLPDDVKHKFPAQHSAAL